MGEGGGGEVGRGQGMESKRIFSLRIQFFSASQRLEFSRSVARGETFRKVYVFAERVPG